MNGVDETKNSNGRAAARQTRRFEISLPVASARVLEAASILGGYESVEAFIVEAAAEKSVQLSTEEMRQQIRAVLTHEGGHGKARKASRGVTSES